MEDKSKLYGGILGIVLFILLVAGFTYAFVSWQSGKTTINMNTGCFDIWYDKGQDITGEMIPSSTYTGGLYATVKINIKSTCSNVKADGVLYLDTLSTTSSNLYTRGLLNYQVVKGTTPLNVKGTITQSGKISLPLGELTSSTSASTTYKVYVWIKDSAVENSDANSKYYGQISASATQK